MKIAVINSVSGISAKALVLALNTRSFGVCQAEAFKPHKIGRYDYTDFDWVISLGYGSGTKHKAGRRLNIAEAVCNCVYKPATFDIMKAAGVPTVEYCLANNLVPKTWETIVVRNDTGGRKAEGLLYVSKGERIPEGQLFSEYFEHKFEYRIMVWKGEVVGRYFKHEEEGDWYFNLQPAKGFEAMDAACELAAKALKIDYVGFDVVAQNKKDFRVLEANSGALLTDEMETAIVEHFTNL